MIFNDCLITFEVLLMVFDVFSAFWSEPTDLTFYFIRNGDSYAGFNLHLGHFHLLSVKVFEVISITQACVGDWVRCYATCQHVWNNLTFKYNSISLLITYLPLQSNSIVYPPTLEHPISCQITWIDWWCLLSTGHIIYRMMTVIEDYARWVPSLD